MTRIVLRTLALVIALAAFVDPTISSRRGLHPEIAVIPGNPSSDSAAAGRIARELENTFDVVRAPTPASVATVVAGDALPAARDLVTSPVVGVASARGGAPVIESIATPSQTVVGSQLAVSVAVGSKDDRTLVTLRANGVQVDSQVLARPAGDSVRMVRLTYVPPSAGPTRLQVVASANGGATTADALVNVTDTRWRVLFYDAHPSWMSTFVRRAIERDARFETVSRVITSRGISRDVGTPPARLDDPSVLAYDAIVVGAPEGLTANEVDGLERFMRRRGGSVILLLDEDSTVAPYDRLRNLVRTADAPKACCGPVGAGQLTINGATDAWQHRDSTFDRTWQSVVADAAAAAVPAVSVRVTPAILSPGDTGVVTVTSREEFLRGSGALTVAARLGERDVRLWPTFAAGELRGTVSAPAAPGRYQLDVSMNGTTFSAPVIVAPDARQPRGASNSLLRAWVASRGGVVLQSDRARDIVAAIDRVRTASTAAEPWHPMRSLWWMLPFTIALAAEWWLRRRRGLR